MPTPATLVLTASVLGQEPMIARTAVHEDDYWGSIEVVRALAEQLRGQLRDPARAHLTCHVLDAHEQPLSRLSHEWVLALCREARRVFAPPTT